jgi:hypothetical protein
MISVRCPACGKVVGFEESDGGALVHCPHCREPFFVPAVAQPITADGAPATAIAQVPPPLLGRLPQAPSLPDDIRIADDPDLEPIPELLDEVLPADDQVPPPQSAIRPAPDAEPQSAPEPQPAAQLEPIPNLELSPLRLEPEPAEPTGTPPAVQPTDVAPSLAAAAALSEALPPEEPKEQRPTDLLEEVTDDRADDDRFRDEEEKVEDRRRRRAESLPEDEENERAEDETPRPRRRVKKKGAKPRPRVAAGSPWPEGLTRDRVLGGVGLAAGGTILMGTVLHHLTASETAWHPAVCCSDLFALTLCGAALYLLIKR